MSNKQPAHSVDENVVDLSDFDLPTDFTAEIAKTLEDCEAPRPSPSKEKVKEAPPTGWFRSLLRR